MGEMKYQEVKNYAIDQIWLCANGFRRDFYVIAYDDLKVYTNNDDSNITPSFITVGIFSVELYLKFLHTVASVKIEEDSLIGEHPKEHDLSKLFESLPNEIKVELENLYIEKVSTKIANTLSEYLSSIKKCYTELRYPYICDVEFTLFNCNALKDVVEIFKLYSDKEIDKFWRNSEYNEIKRLNMPKNFIVINPWGVRDDTEDFLRKYKETGNKENN